MIDAIQVAGIGKNIHYDVNDKPLKYIPNISIQDTSNASDMD